MSEEKRIIYCDECNLGHYTLSDNVLPTCANCLYSMAQNRKRIIAEQDAEITKLKAEVERLNRDLNHQVYLGDKRRREGIIEGFNAAREMIEGFDPSSNINTSARLKFFRYLTSENYLSNLDSKKQKEGGK